VSGEHGVEGWEGWGVSGGRRIACCGEGYSPWGCTGSTGRAGCHDLFPNSRFLSDREIGKKGLGSLMWVAGGVGGGGGAVA